MIEHDLAQIGLTKTEIRLYLALLRVGQSTTTPLAQEAQVPPSKVYEYLHKLIQKGLVTYTLSHGKKQFCAQDPESLLHFLHSKKEKIDNQEKNIRMLLPQLRSMMETPKIHAISETYEGLEGIKILYERILHTLGKGDTQYIIGAPRIANEMLEGYLLEWHKRRIRKGIRCCYLYDANARPYGTVRERMKLTKVRYLPPHLISPVWIEIFHDTVAIGHVMKWKAVLFVITDKEIASTYRGYFHLMWKASTS